MRKEQIVEGEDYATSYSRYGNSVSFSYAQVIAMLSTKVDA